MTTKTIVGELEEAKEKGLRICAPCGHHYRVPFLVHATEVYRRTCPYHKPKLHWQVTIEPMMNSEQMVVHKLTWIIPSEYRTPLVEVFKDA